MSYHTLPPSRDHEEDPDEMDLQVGESRQSGTVVVQRAGSELYVAECGSCGWRKKYPTSSPNGASWDTHCHNVSRRKSGCPSNPTREE